MSRWLQRLLLVWLLISSCIAFFWNEFAAFAGFDPFSKSVNRVTLPWLIVVTMFAIGWMLPRDEVRQVISRWRSVLGGTALQYLSMPALAFLWGKALGLSGDYFVGLVMVGCVPGAMASNVLTLLARGNASYSVSLTTSATLLSPLAVPLAMGVFLSASGEGDVKILINASITLGYQVVAPVVCGHLLGRRFPQWEDQARAVGSTIANLAILWIIAAIVGENREILQSSTPPALFGALLLVNGCGYLTGTFGGFIMALPKPMRRALTLEIGMQNAGLGAVLVTQLFPDRSAVAIAPVLYMFGCMLTGTMLASWWALGNSTRREKPHD